MALIAECFITSRASPSMTRPAKQLAPSTLYVGSELGVYNGLAIFFAWHQTAWSTMRSNTCTGITAQAGDILMDVPDYSWTELVQLAANRDACRQLVRSIREPRSHVTINAKDSSISMNANPARDARAARRHRLKEGREELTISSTEPKLNTHHKPQLPPQKSTS